MNCLNKLIYAMQIAEWMGFNTYWHDHRFQYKKPILNGSLVQMYGDNIYHENKEDGNWIQANSAHSNDFGPNLKHQKRDLKGERVLVGDHFWYFGNKALETDHLDVERELGYDMLRRRNFRKLDPFLGKQILDWIYKNYKPGIHGDPVNWSKYQPSSP